MKKKIEIEYACKACEATGLYVGMAEKDGAAIVCNVCKGTGKAVHKFEYEDFSGLKGRNDVKQVFETNPGIFIGEGKAQFKLSDFGGMSYAEWLKGLSFGPGTENRKFTCPAWWYQSVNCKLKPDWKECRLGGAFSDCKEFPNKAKCWERWDKEFGKKAAP